MSALAGAALALIGFVITQGILKFVIEPIQEQRRLIGEVAHVLSTFLNVPVEREDVDRGELEELWKETRKALRDQSGRLWASLWAIPFYNAFALVRLVPKMSNVKAAATSLTVWSYYLTSPMHRVTERADSQRVRMEAWRRTRSRCARPQGAATSA
jgi:hypothetical protein